MDIEKDDIAPDVPEDDTLKLAKDQTIKDQSDIVPSELNEDPENDNDNMDLNVSKDSKTDDDDDDIPVQTDSRGNMIYTCNICHIYKGTADQVKSHMATDHSEYPYVCKNLLCVKSL